MILRLQSEQQLQELEKRIKTQCKSLVHESSFPPYITEKSVKTPSQTRQDKLRASKALGVRGWQVQSPLEAEFMLQIKSAKLELPFEQFKVFVDRRFRLDFAWPAQKVAVLIQGNVHRIQEKFYRDCELFCLLTMAGWKFLPLSRKEVKSTKGLKWLKTLLAAEL